MKVRVYFNLHKNVYSVQHWVKGKGWRLFKHEDAVFLKDVSFKVYETGRQRVLSERRKNVHAYVIGDLCFEAPLHYIIEGYKVRYNPYVGSSFFTQFADGTAAALSGCKHLLMTVKDGRPNMTSERVYTSCAEDSVKYRNV